MGMETQTTLVQTFQEKVRAGGRLIAVAAGNGITAKYAVRCGCDFILALSAGKFRQMGRGSLTAFLCYSNSNEETMEFATRDLLPAVPQTPVLFGLNATDPTISLYEYIERIRDSGFCGVNNFPSIGMIDGQFRLALEQEQISYQREIDAIRFAHYCGLFTVAFAFEGWQGREMAKAGADVVCAHFGLTRGGMLGARKVPTLERARVIANEVFSEAQEVNPDIIKMIYGGAIRTPLDVQYMYQHCGSHGFIGGSVFDRIPIESAVTDTIQSFIDAPSAKPRTSLEKILFSNGRQYNYVDFVKEFISENYDKKIRLEELAQVTYLSPSYLSTLFCREIGMSFRDYLMKFRMEKARELIHGGQHSLLEVSLLVGYQDYIQFSKMYKKFWGTSPGSERYK